MPTKRKLNAKDKLVKLLIDNGVTWNPVCVANAILEKCEIVFKE